MARSTTESKESFIRFKDNVSYDKDISDVKSLELTTVPIYMFGEQAGKWKNLLFGFNIDSKVEYKSNLLKCKRNNVVFKFIDIIPNKDLPKNARPILVSKNQDTPEFQLFKEMTLLNNSMTFLITDEELSRQINIHECTKRLCNMYLLENL